jgi:Predicted pyridoxal phosphate-dependent enzyme apparently involved in regulation of cell wall biogenesis
VQAAIGLAQAERLREHVKIKRRNFKIYEDELRRVSGLTMLSEPLYAVSNYWFYSLLVDKDRYGISNMELQRVLKKYGIETRLLWELNHKQLPYKNTKVIE